MVRSVPVLFEFYSFAKVMTLFLNSEHVNIKFPFQNKSIVAKLALFEILISKNDTYYCSTAYCKKNSVSQYTNFVSFSPYPYKFRLIKTSKHRTYETSSSWSLFIEKYSNDEKYVP